MRESRPMTEKTPQQTQLIQRLQDFEPWDARESEHRDIILEQVEATPLWWHRDTLPGHVTASGFVVDQALEYLLLHHHRKLDRWLQLGGHDEGEQDPAAAVLREVQEESGLQSFTFYDGPHLFDVDVHRIPENKKMASHLHLDCRFLLVADRHAPLVAAEAESLSIGWFPLEDAVKKMGEVGAQRIAEKIRRLR